MTTWNQDNPANPDDDEAVAVHEHNDENQPREQSTTINVPQTSVAPPAPVYDEPGEIGIPNVVPDGYDPSQQPAGEKHGVPQPPKTVDEAKDAGLLPHDFDANAHAGPSREEEIERARANREAEERRRERDNR